MNLIGHEKQKGLLEKMVSSGKIPHNLLFSGPESVGKKRVAIELTKRLNCQSEGCNECKTCKDIESGKHVDLFKIEDKEEIKIDDIRDLQKRLSLTGETKKSYKVAIIDEAHLLNSQAQACLLKTLEEPKGNALIILITKKPNTLLDTILSRMWSIKFSFVSTEEIVDYLISLGADENQAEEIAELSFSKPGLAKKLFQDEKFKKKWIEKGEKLDEIRDSYMGKRFDYVKKIAKDKKQAKETLRIWASILRREMMEAEDEKAIKNKESLEVIQDILLLTSKTNVNFKLALEKVIINL